MCQVASTGTVGGEADENQVGHVQYRGTAHLVESRAYQETCPLFKYIIVHEMLHLLERLHNERFIAYMNRFMPLWQYYREELNRAPLGHESWEY